MAAKIGFSGGLRPGRTCLAGCQQRKRPRLARDGIRLTVRAGAPVLVFPKGNSIPTTSVRVGWLYLVSEQLNEQRNQTFSPEAGTTESATTLRVRVRIPEVGLIALVTGIGAASERVK
jgi:hypothetical protein